MTTALEVPAVTSVDAWLVRLPLARPVHFAARTWATWHYVIVRVDSASGHSAGTYSFIGEIPIDLMVTDIVAPNLAGRAGDDLRTVAEQCALAAGPTLGDVVRPAASLVEVCLWDIVSQQEAKPLWSLLSNDPVRPSAPVMLVDHRRDGDSVGSFAQRIASLAGVGSNAVKIKHYGDAAETRALLEAIRQTAGPEIEIVVDVGWAWDDLGSAIAEARLWDECRLAWIEDPFPPHLVREAAALRSAVDSPIGIGDMVTSLSLAERLIDEGAVDVLRVDATMMGGLAAMERLDVAATAAGVRLSPELMIELHQHLAFALPSVTGVEMYAPDSGIWSGDVFVRPGAFAWDGGQLLPPAGAGSGLAIDWEAVGLHATRHSRYQTG